MRAIVELERLRVVGAVQMEERQVPEVVERESVVRRPVALARHEPLDALADAPLHLHHVRRRVHRPAVLRLDRERGARGLLGLGVLVHLLEAERVHAEHVRVAGNVAAPVRQHARDAVAQVQRVAAVEVHQVRDLQRERVAGKVREHRVERAAGGMPVAGGDLRGRLQQPELAGVRARAVVARCRDRLRDRRRVLPFGQRREHQRLHQVAGDEIGRLGERAVDRGDRIADVGLELADRRLVAGDRRGGSGRHRDSSCIVSHGAVPSCCSYG